ncbi:MAG: hypothetical protein FJ090_00545 [Deltaproteobacteria bacterium]|nr:hypothetical protein [Deltaproteobacteria bacterium]
MSREAEMASTWKDVLELAVAIELECAALYEVFAKTFADKRELAYFWRLYAEAERYHAASIRIHQSAMSTARPQGEQGYDAESTDAAAFLAEIREERARCERHGIGVADALRLARRVEEHSAELHGRTQFFKLFPEFGDLLVKMADEDKAHRDLLATAEKRWG